MSSPHHSVTFEVLETLFLVVFIAGCWMHVAFWLRGHKEEGSSIRKAIRLLLELWTRLRTAEGLRAVFVETLLQVRLRRVSLGRWVLHLGLAFGLVLLFLIGSGGDWLTDHRLWAVQKDTPWFAVVNELLGLLLFAVVLAALARRYVFPDKVPIARTWTEGLPGLWLVALIVTGYLLEGARLALSKSPSIVGLSFIGGLAARTWQAASLTPQTYQALWWTHTVLALGFVAYLPYSPIFHLFLAPLTALLSSPRLRDAEATSEGARTVDAGLTSVVQRVQMDSCTRCRECVRWCEAHFARPGDATSASCRVRKYQSWMKSETLPLWIARLIDGKPFREDSLAAFAQDVYQCTLCARCVEACPVKIDLLSLWLSLRSEVARRGLQPESLGLLREAVAAEHNILNFPNPDRDLWVDYSNDAPEDRWQREGAEVLYFVGCMSSFSPAAQNIPVAFAELMQEAGVHFSILGGEEWCCGFPLLAAGLNGPQVEELLRHNVGKLSVLGADTVVFNCPSCFQTWQRHYRRRLPQGIKLLHSTQFVAQLIAEGQLSPNRLDRIITYHDPCDLGRNSGVYEEPRQVLRALPGIEFREAAYIRESAHCCGGGGDLEAADPALAKDISAQTLHALEDAGADTLVVACPQCKRMLQDAARNKKSKTEVMDLVELVRRAIE